MTKRIDYVAEARKLLEMSHRTTSLEIMKINQREAQAHAILALVEQQRIANVLKVDEMAMRGNYNPSDDMREVLGL